MLNVLGVVDTQTDHRTGRTLWELLAVGMGLGREEGGRREVWESG
jgi:hypothetical protein